METDIIVNVATPRTRVAIMQDGELAELLLESEDRVVGNIYLARVENVVPGLDAAFVDCGMDKNAFLHVSDAMETEPSRAQMRRKMESFPPIKEVVKNGDQFLVQVTKGPVDAKGARATRRLALPSRNLVLMADGRGKVGVSKKIEDEQERARLASEILGERKMLAEALDVLAPSDLPEARENARASAGPTAEGLQFYLNQPLYINQPVPKPEGLLARYLRLQLDIERVRRGGASGTTASLQQLALEEDALSATITRIQSNVSLHENALAGMQQRLSAVIRMISDKVSERARLRDPLDRFRAVAAAYVHWDGKGLPVAGDLRVLSQPVMPELRVWPKRTLVAGATALVAVLLYVSFLLVRFPLIRHQQHAR